MLLGRKMHWISPSIKLTYLMVSGWVRVRSKTVYVCLQHITWQDGCLSKKAGEGHVTFHFTSNSVHLRKTELLIIVLGNCVEEKFLRISVSFDVIKMSLFTFVEYAILLSLSEVTFQKFAYIDGNNF